MFGLKIFVRVHTFRRAPAQLLPPWFKHTQWSYMCLMLSLFINLENQNLYPAQITTSPDEQPSTLSIRWDSANKYKLNWNRTKTSKHQKIAGTDSTLQSTRYWTGILMLLQLGKTTDVEPQPRPQPRASKRYVLSSGLYTLCYKFDHIVQSWNRLLKI